MAWSNSILSFTRDDAKQEAKSLVDLSALVEGICEDAADAGEKVTFSGPRGVTLSCRPSAMRRAISNLVDNAVKYGGMADVTLASEAGRVVILVEDEGPGIPAERAGESVRALLQDRQRARPQHGWGRARALRHSVDRLGARRRYHPRQSKGRRIDRPP